MKSDNFFYELFQTAPQTFFELLQITPPCPYTFESITVKTTEKRIDGLFEPTQPSEPIYFVEVQASPDESMYWRTLREVATYFEYRPERKNEWHAVVIWLNKEDDPGLGEAVVLNQAGQVRLRAVYLLDLLKKLPDKSLALNVLRPFTVDTEQEVRQNLSTWVTQIQQTPQLEPHVEQRLTTVLTQLIEEKFKTLDYEELRTMLHLAPFKETRSVQKVLREDRTELLTKLIRRKYKFAETTFNNFMPRLRRLTLTDLEDLFESIFDLTTFGELNAWVNSRLLLQRRADKVATNGELSRATTNKEISE